MNHSAGDSKNKLFARDMSLMQLLKDRGSILQGSFQKECPQLQPLM